MDADMVTVLAQLSVTVKVGAVKEAVPPCDVQIESGTLGKLAGETTGAVTSRMMTLAIQVAVLPELSKPAGQSDKACCCGVGNGGAVMPVVKLESGGRWANTV